MSRRRNLLRSQRGIGLVELLAAMTVLMVGILALFAMFESGIRHLSRASTITTAGALADREMESYRAIKYASIGLPESLVAPLASDAVYSGDAAWQSSSANRVGLDACGAYPCSSDVPVQTLTGADGKSYLVHTYITWQTVGTGRLVKLVTVVVRDAATPTKVWARAASAFDRSTGE